jgi:phosphoserine phosphatase RsbU/P
VGGDFYTFMRLGDDRIGVMLGDVSSHGISAALVMALVLSAAGIHAPAAAGPADTLLRLRESLVGKLSETEMYASVFYAVLDRTAGTLVFANAGHPHAFLLHADGRSERLEATAPPLGLGFGAPIGQTSLSWDDAGDLLCLWTDGLVDAANPEGMRFGEPRLLERLTALRDQAPDAILEAILTEADTFSAAPSDDRTLLVLRGS